MAHTKNIAKAKAKNQKHLERLKSKHEAINHLLENSFKDRTLGETVSVDNFATLKISIDESSDQPCDPELIPEVDFGEVLSDSRGTGSVDQDRYRDPGT